MHPYRFPVMAGLETLIHMGDGREYVYRRMCRFAFFTTTLRCKRCKRFLLSAIAAGQGCRVIHTSLTVCVWSVREFSSLYRISIP